MPSGRMFALLTLPLLGPLLALLAVACGDDDAAPAGGAVETRKITFMAGFRPQANLPFVAAYVALDQGYFADEGLGVEIQHSPSGGHLQLLLAGEIDFTTGTAARVIQRRAEQLPVRAVALFGQRGDQGYVVRADSGIRGPADFEGRSVGFRSGVVPPELKAMLASVGLAEDDVDLQGVPFDVRPFIEGAVDVYPVFLNNEPDTIRREGLEIEMIDPHDFGVPTLGLTFLAREQTVADDPELVERFLRAALRGVEYAAGHIDEAVEITLRYAEGADPAHQRFLLEMELVNAQRDDGIGRGSPEQWEALEALLRRFQVIETEVDVSLAFDGSFVDALYDDQGRLR